jgi:cell division transport system permease protein
MLKDSQFIFEGLDENPLPDSLEIKLKDEALASESVKALAKEALSIQGVSEVDYGEKFLSTIHNLKKGLNSVGVILIIILSTGIIFVCYSTVKILFYRRMDEIETYKLLGATKWFIRSPFLIEGMLIGLAGGIISLLGINAFHYFSILKLSITIPLFKSIIFPTRLFLWLPVIGLLLGISGAGVALGRMKY